MAIESASTSDNTNIFRELEEYDWDKDEQFQGGLEAILGPNPSPSQENELTLRAQCFYLSRKKGIPIDFDAYKTYLASKTVTSEMDSQIPTLSSTLPPDNISSSQSTPAPSDLPPSGLPHLTPTTSQTATSATSSSNSDTTPTSTLTMPPPALTSDPKQAPYPASFAEIVAMITSGTPIPGIVDIPPIILHGQGSKPTLKARRKPWEMHKTEEEVQAGKEGVFGDRRDTYIPQKFPEEGDVKVAEEK